MDLKIRLEEISTRIQGQYWGERICNELHYLQELIGGEEALRAQLQKAADYIEEMLAEEGAITKKTALAVEEQLTSLGPKAKELTLLCAAHAHIDMNWQWGLAETVGATIDTFQTMLDLLEEYPEYIYTQSQASTYEIIEKYAPDMLPAIRKYVQEGRWELTATAWVEADKNMPNTESQVRHIQYTKQYLSKLFGVAKETMELDMEPDTFGHGHCVPEVLVQGGVRYYYHCRGNDAEELYRWRAPSGQEVLVHREPNWYLGPITYDMAAYLPGFCRRNRVKTGLKVYGVGDHGGGPTRRDLERILDMKTWPLMPTIAFSRIDTYFHKVEGAMEHFPVVERELNFVFTGCYTTQTRIKQANRYGEDRLYDSEALSAMARLAGVAPESAGFQQAWKNILFNHFHDILPGSGVRETREHALGTTQETYSYCVGNASRAMHAMKKQIDTSAFGLEVDPDSTAEGAGVGFGAAKGSAQERAFAATTFQVTQVTRSGGLVRAYTLFNPTQYDREEVVELTLWDWQLPMYRTAVCNADGQEIPFEAMEENKDYWRHVFSRIVFPAKVPAFGYANYYVVEAKQPRAVIPYSEPRVHRMSDKNPVMENDFLRAEFKRSSMELISLVDKTSGTELLSGPSYFRYVEEKDVGAYSSWVIGPYAKIVNLNDTCFVDVTQEKCSGIRQQLCYKLQFGASTLQVCITLDGQSKMLRFSTEVDWHEVGHKDSPIPQLNFYVPYRYTPSAIRYEVAGGYIDRPELGHDVPAQMYAAPIREEGCGLVMTTDCKYGYRAFENALSVTLLRASYVPDKYPEFGVNQMELGLGLALSSDWKTLNEAAFCFSHPLYVSSNSLHTGTLPPAGRLLTLHGDVRVTALKPAEQGSGVVLRGYQNNNCTGTLSVACQRDVCVSTVDLCEEKILAATAELTMDPWMVNSVLLEFVKE